MHVWDMKYVNYFWLVIWHVVSFVLFYELLVWIPSVGFAVI